MNDLIDFRHEIDHFMKNHPQSPLDHDQRHDFQGLNYYEYNEDLLLDVKIERFPDDEPIVIMQTSTGDTQDYRRWGQFSFLIGDQPATLVIYSDPLGQEFFMPFKDATNGKESYGAGRYMDSHRPGMRRIGNDSFEIDFNYAYNPYCAYSVAYFSCPLTSSAKTG